ncbi:prephenate dehydratase domain-containing protein [Sphingomonas sp. CCH10-B3]|uniref:prephenate dehydratase domain-containing protein n=1 Tax=Sphingomonas sp. CCH10-B3 TaxID=1768757 RepID=UPI00082EDC99|nr:prephenate dehydratase domain-containing protein [Sphingomonas sp. CCH10-B3]
MERFPAPARPIVAAMTAAAAADPAHAVAFQGAPGANSHIAALQAVPDGLPLPCFDFDDAIEAVQSGSAELAIIPIENSLHGRVADIHFLLPESGLTIIGEFFLPIRYAMMGLGTRGDVREAVSHPQALGQCRQWLRVAALAPAIAADTYGLKLLVEDIADEAHNMTRFVLLAQQAIPLDGDGPFVTTLIFALPNAPAALYKALGGFATAGVNMTKLESYQRGASFTATEFYADFIGRPGDPAVDRALSELGFHAEWVRLLGTYPMARER